MKDCKDCRYYRPEEAFDDPSGEFAQCAKSNAGMTYVENSREFRFPLDILLQVCGRRGRWFEAKPAEVLPPVKSSSPPMPAVKPAKQPLAATKPSEWPARRDDTAPIWVEPPSWSQPTWTSPARDDDVPAVRGGGGSFDGGGASGNWDASPCSSEPSSYSTDSSSSSSDSSSSCGSD